MATAQRNLVLILARDFASRLATPVCLVDPNDTLIYFNEAAERMLGTTFVEGREIPADEWLGAIEPADPQGRRLANEERPLAIALRQGMPSHRTLTIRDASGSGRRIEVTAFPLFAHTEECVGAMSIFWEPAEPG